MGGHSEFRKDSEKAGSRFGNNQHVGSNNQFKHQIEVMVLSKVDPFDGAFPVPGSGSVVPTAGQYMQPRELNLTQSFTQPQIIQAKKIIT